MWPRKIIDISWSDLAFGFLKCATPGKSSIQQQYVEEQFGGQEHSLICLSVRTGFDLLLQSLQLPPGSEVVMTAITIPDMIAIVESHGLVPVPLDLDFKTLTPSTEALEKSLTPRTRLILVGHLFGTRMPVDQILRVARERQLLVIEDCAQA